MDRKNKRETVGRKMGKTKREHYSAKAIVNKYFQVVNFTETSQPQSVARKEILF